MMSYNKLSLAWVASALALHSVCALGQDTAMPSTSEMPHQKSVAVMGEFETGDLSAADGSWMKFTDQFCCGGSSTTEIEVVAGGADGTERSLSVRGETVANDIWVGAGALFWFASRTDLSAKSEITFWARGEGDTYRLFIFGRNPAEDIDSEVIVAGAEWEEVRIPLSALAGIDLRDVSGFLIGRGEPAGAFSLQIDEVRLR